MGTDVALAVEIGFRRLGSYRQPGGGWSKGATKHASGEYHYVFGRKRVRPRCQFVVQDFYPYPSAAEIFLD